MISIGGLLRGELWLTFDIIFGLILGDAIVRWGIAERLMRRITPFLRRQGLDEVTGLALAVSLGSSRAGAALLASALEENKISEKAALWGVLMLPFPAYLRRWPATCAMAFSMAGISGFIFALSLILRSGGRFVLAFFVLRRVRRLERERKHEHEREAGEAALSVVSGEQFNEFNEQNNNNNMGGGVNKIINKKIINKKKLLRTMPLAWLFFAAAYGLVPYINGIFREFFLFTDGKFLPFMPLAGWTVAAGSIVNVSAALALAGGSLAAGELGVAEAVFSLILGSGLGVVTRILRQDAGYYFGLFRAGLARRMLIYNMLTVLMIVILCLILSAVPLVFF